MKPSDLQPPCSREEKQVIIHDRVWYVPEKPQINIDFAFPGWSHPDFFGNDNPVHVEYCSGNGAWIAEKALMHPNINWVGIEIQFSRVRKLWSKIKNFGLSNLIVLCGEASHATKSYFLDQTIDRVYINFPDPWPKNRHAKHRLIQVEFADELWRILKQGKDLTYVTDHPSHSKWLVEVLNKQSKFAPAFPFPHYVTDQNSYGTSYFDQLWRSQGKTIFYHQYYKS